MRIDISCKEQKKRANESVVDKDNKIDDDHPMAENSLTGMRSDASPIKQLRDNLTGEYKTYLV